MIATKAFRTGPSRAIFTNRFASQQDQTIVKSLVVEGKQSLRLTPTGLLGSNVTSQAILKVAPMNTVVAVTPKDTLPLHESPLAQRFHRSQVAVDSDRWRCCTDTDT